MEKYHHIVTPVSWHLFCKILDNTQPELKLIVSLQDSCGEVQMQQQYLLTFWWRNHFCEAIHVTVSPLVLRIHAPPYRRTAATAPEKSIIESLTLFVLFYDIICSRTHRLPLRINLQMKTSTSVTPIFITTACCMWHFCYCSNAGQFSTVTSSYRNLMLTT